jgi:hypothetical protein
MIFRGKARGASLIETMIAVGILGAIAYFMAGVIRNGLAGQKALQVQDDSRTMTENMAAILSDPVACGNSLVTPPLSPAAGGAISAIKDAVGNVAYLVGNSYSAKSIKLESIQLGGTGTDAKTGIQKWTPLGSPATGGTAFVQITWSQPTATGNSSGPAKLTKFFLVNALSLSASGAIVTCMAQSSAGGGGAGFWTKNSAGDIYNNNTITAGTAGGVGLGTAAPKGIFDVYAGGSHAFFVNGLGNIGIGTTSPAYRLDVAGDVQAISFISTSDERLKTDIHPLEGLPKVLALRGVRFRWRKDGSAAIGLIAQEVEKIFPEIVSTSVVSGFKAIRYDALIAPLVEAVKDLYGMCQQALSLATANSRRIADLEASNGVKDAAIQELQMRVEEQGRVLSQLRLKMNKASGY